MTKPVIISFRWENTLFCFLVQHVKKNITHLFIYLFISPRKACFRAEWNFELCQIMLFVLIYPCPWAPAGCFGNAKCCWNRSETLGRERTSCGAHCLRRLCSGVAVLRSPRSRWDCPQDSPHRLAPSPVCSCIPGCKQPTGSCLPQEMPAATDEHWMKGNVLGEHMAFSWSWTSAGLSLVLPCSKNPAVTRLELPGVMSLNWVDFSMHIYKQVDKHFLNPAKLLTFASEMVFFSEML